MSLEHPLRNPSVSDFKPQEAPALKIKRAPISPEQLPLTVSKGGQRWERLLGSFKDFVEHRERELELMPFWRHFAAPFAVVSAVAAILFMIILGVFRFGSLPPTVPFYFNYETSRWVSVDKSFMIITPIALAVVELVLIRLIYDIFRFDERLSVILSWLLTVVNMLGLAAVGQIYTLIS